MLFRSVSDGIWSVDFSQSQAMGNSNYDPYDIGSLDQGTASQNDADGDCTTISWNAPNPELKVDPLLDTIQGFGWKSEVDVAIYDGGTLLHSAMVPTDADGNFELYLIGIVDIVSGYRIVLDDGMTVHDYTVSVISITRIDTVDEIIYGIKIGRAHV